MEQRLIAALDAAGHRHYRALVCLRLGRPVHVKGEIPIKVQQNQSAFGVIFAVCPRLFTDFMGVSWASGRRRTLLLHGVKRPALLLNHPFWLPLIRRAFCRAD
jgi:hypothetical protein